MKSSDVALGVRCNGFKKGSQARLSEGQESLGHTQWSMQDSHTKAISTNWEKKRSGTMAKLPHASAEMRALYLVFRRRELAAGWRDTTLHRDPLLRGDLIAPG